MLSFLCLWLLPPAMTGDRCYRRKTMAGEEDHVVSAEAPCPADFPARRPEIGDGGGTALRMDYFSQARKALSERSPFDVPGEPSTSAAVTLPSGLASLLNRHGDSRRRQKKSHSGGGDKKKKKSSRANDKSRVANIWVETEEYFRDLALSDIDALVELSSSCSSLASRECFTIPRLGDVKRFNVVSTSCVGEKYPAPMGFNGVSTSCVDEQNSALRGFNVVSSEEDKKNGEDLKNEDGLLGVESIDNAAAAETALPQDDKNPNASDSCVSLEWFLGCRNKVSSTTERPRKRRKLLGGDAGLERVLMTSPSDGNQPFCHYCGKGDLGTGRDSDRLIVCSCCKVAVHQKCYGVQDENVDESWLCSWCKQKGDVGDSANPCVLCPKKGGALKPLDSSVEGGGSAQFVHLFCGLWMPQVYVDDLKKMEPVMNVGSIKETRRKLVCNVCKMKCGTCVRCNHGTCRTSFHPLCAREARQRMEVWAKYGNDNVELRAFCLKHSNLQEDRSILPLGGRSIAAGGDFSEANDLPVTLPVSSEHNVKIVCDNGGLVSNSIPDKLNHNGVPPDDGLQHDIGVSGKTNEHVGGSDSLSFVLVLKKLIDRGKVDVKDVALEIGISSDALAANINEACMDPDVQHKIVNWLKSHVHTSAFQKGLKFKFKPANPFKDGNAARDGSETLPISDSGLLDPVAVKSVPPRRRTVSNIRILNDDKVIGSSEGVASENGMPMDKFHPDSQNPGSSNEESIHDATEMNTTKSEDTFHEVQVNLDEHFKSSFSGCFSEEQSTVCLQNALMLSDQHCPGHSASEPPDSGFIKIEAISSYIHPQINKKLLRVRGGLPLEDVVESSGASGCSKSQDLKLTCSDKSEPDRVKMDQLARDEKVGLWDFSPEDELEGELIYLQHKLLHNAVGRKRLADNLIYNVAKSLPQEIDKAHQQRWDTVTVNQYLRDLREAKKQGRKEKRHKEAQAVLAAATAAAAASSRVSSFRKDTLDEAVQHENLIKLDTSSGRTGGCTQPMPRAKETLSRVAVTRNSSDKYSDFCPPTSDFSKEQRKSCDICRLCETMLKRILVCSGCKVAVHLDCYRSVEGTMGPWYCELCEELSSRSSGASAINFQEKPYFVAECALCGGTSGAFRKSSDGQWVHAFCAEWVFESTFKRGQIDAVEGMESVPKGVDMCCICRRKHGVCMKCCYGHCQTTFHPSCARSAGLFMNVRTVGGKLQHKAYCEKHSLEQKAKAESQKHGIEELKSLKHIRVELERLRLLCERIVRREKTKRELVLCSHKILAFRRDEAARSVLVRGPFVLPDGSSESATTSLKANTEGYRSCSEALQRSDDITVDSSVSAKHRVRVAVSMDTDPKLDDDCSTSQSRYNHKIPERMQFSGKQIPHRASTTSRNISDEGGWIPPKSRKPSETFGKEIIMTSDEASMKNSRLPKGYAYVPADCLSNDKQSKEDTYADEPVDHDR